MSHDARTESQHAQHVFINPGSGPVEGGWPEHAEDNMYAFLDDLGVEQEGPQRYYVAAFTAPPMDGRWKFQLRGGPCDVALDVWMPGLPLDEVRYMGEGQNPWHFPRLFIGEHADSWLWCYALEVIAEKLESFQ